MKALFTIFATLNVIRSCLTMTALHVPWSGKLRELLFLHSYRYFGGSLKTGIVIVDIVEVQILKILWSSKCH